MEKKTYTTADIRKALSVVLRAESGSEVSKEEYHEVEDLLEDLHRALMTTHSAIEYTSDAESHRYEISVRKP